MASPALGGILQGLMAGWERGDQKTREREHDQRVREDYAYQRQRRGVVDAQNDQAFGLRLEDRERNIKREDKADARVETQFNQSQEDRAHALERRPVLEAQEDERYGLQTALTKQQMAQSKAQHGVNMSEAAIRAEMARMGLNEAKVQQHANQSRRAFAAGLALFDATGDTESMRVGLNATIGKDHGYQVKSIRQNDDGSFSIDFGGDKPMVLNDRKALEEAAFKLTEPETYLDVWRSTLAQRAGLPVAGQGRGQGSAQQQMVAWLYQNLPAKEGESPEQRSMRAWQTYKSTQNLSPERVYIDMLKALIPAGATDKDVQRAKEQAQKFAQEFSAQQGATPQSAPPAAAKPPMGGSGDPSQPQTKRVVRTGTAPDGTKVVQYDDGTIGPAPAQ